MDSDLMEEAIMAFNSGAALAVVMLRRGECGPAAMAYIDSLLQPWMQQFQGLDAYGARSLVEHAKRLGAEHKRYIDDLEVKCKKRRRVEHAGEDREKENKDFQGAEAEAIRAEEDAQKSNEDFVKETNASIEETNASIKETNASIEEMNASLQYPPSALSAHSCLQTLVEHDSTEMIEPTSPAADTKDDVPSKHGKVHAASLDMTDAAAVQAAFDDSSADSLPESPNVQGFAASPTPDLSVFGDGEGERCEPATNALGCLHQGCTTNAEDDSEARDIALKKFHEDGAARAVLSQPRWHDACVRFGNRLQAAEAAKVAAAEAARVETEMAAEAAELAAELAAEAESARIEKVQKEMVDLDETLARVSKDADTYRDTVPVAYDEFLNKDPLFASGWTVDASDREGHF